MPLSRKVLALVALAAVGTAGYLYYARHNAAPATADKPDSAESDAVPVIVAEAQRKPLPITLAVIGNVQAYSSVAVKSRIDGEVLDAPFKEGQAVRKGDVLFTIDARPFEAGLRQAEANLARDKAQLEGAQLDLTRYTQLAKTGYGTQQKFEEAKTSVDSLQATIKADQAAIETAQLNLNYATIRSPIDGRTGSVLIHPGNIVKANDTNALVVINQIHPIYVSFAVPEQYLPEITRRMAQGPMNVEVQLTDENEPPIAGQLTFVNNAVDQTTGTIMLKATFANDDERLVPGAFVHVRLVLKTMENAIVIPSVAVQGGQEGNYVYVVAPDSTVEKRTVTGVVEIGTEAAIKSGVKEGERVVTDGQLRLRPGVRVNAKPAPDANKERTS